MTQDASGSGLLAKQSSDGVKLKDSSKRDKNFQTKVVIRRLPSTMTEAQFLEQVSPVPPNDYFHFVKADLSLGLQAFSRVYLNFLSQEDVFIFKDKFDGYVFIDTKGNEYPAIVEFAPFQKIPKRRSKKRDAKCGTLAQDPEYIKFLANLENPDEGDESGTTPLPTAESYLEEIESRERELKENGGAPKQTTPLIEYLKQRKLERQRIRDEKRDERKRRELEKKKARDEERRKKKSTPSNSGNHDKFESSDSHTNRTSGGHYYSKDSKDNKKDVDNAGIKLTLLKNPERDDVRSTNSSRVSSHHSNSYQEAYSNRERNNAKDRFDRDKGDKRHRDDGERFDRFRNDRVARERGDRRDKDRDSEKFEKNKGEFRDKGEKERTDSDRYDYHDKYNRSDKDKDDRERNDKGFLSRRERERQREKVAAARERERSKLQKEKDEKKTSKSTTEIQKVKGFASKRENSFPPSNSQDGGIIPDDPAIVAAAIEKPKSSSSSTYQANNNEGGSSSSGDSKDPRVERRIRNKDRPSLEIYRPGMRRLSSTGPSQSNAGSNSGKNYSNSDAGQGNSPINSGENSPRGCSPSNNDQPFSISNDPAVEEPLNSFEENPRLSDDNE